MFTFCSRLIWHVINIEWSEADVIERFLRPIGMEFMAKAFIENKINGAVLMCLNEDHMKEMGCAVLGEEWEGQ